MIYLAVIYPDNSQTGKFLNEHMEKDEKANEELIQEYLDNKKDFLIYEDDNDKLTVLVNRKLKNKKISVEKVAGKILINGEEFVENKYGAYDKLKKLIAEVKKRNTEEEDLKELHEEVEDIVEEKATRKQLNTVSTAIIVLLIMNLTAIVLLYNKLNTKTADITYNLTQQTMKMMKLSNDAILTKLKDVDDRLSSVENKTSVLDIVVNNQKVLNTNLKNDYNSIVKGLNNHSKVLGIIANSIIDTNDKVIELEMLITKYLNKKDKGLVAEVKKEKQNKPKNLKDIQQEYKNLLKKIDKIEKQD